MTCKRVFCSLCVWTPYNRMQWNFPQILYTLRGRSTSIFFSEKMLQSLATGNLCSWSIGLQHFKMWRYR